MVTMVTTASKDTKRNGRRGVTSSTTNDITNDRMTDLLDQSEVDGRIEAIEATEATDEAGTTTTDDPHGAEATGNGADSSTKGEYARDGEFDSNDRLTDTDTETHCQTRCCSSETCTTS